MATTEGLPQPQALPTPQTDSVDIQSLPAQPVRDAATDYLACQWLNCGERSPNAESLYVRYKQFELL